MTRPLNTYGVIIIFLVLFQAPVRSARCTGPRRVLCWAQQQQPRRALAQAWAQQQQQPRRALAQASPSPAAASPWGSLRNSDWDRTALAEATQGSAYTSSEGPEEDDEPGDAFNAYSTEIMTAPGGAFYDDDGKQVRALDPLMGVWGGAWMGMKSGRAGHHGKHRPTFRRQNPQTDGNGTVSHYTLEASTQRGVQALSGTMEGARSVAGSNSGFNLASRGSRNHHNEPTGGSVVASNNEAYGPTPGRANSVKDGERRSVAFTDLAPNSAASSGTGYGVVASAAGYEVASAARSERVNEKRATLGHRAPGDNGVWDSLQQAAGRRRLRLKLRKLLARRPSARPT